MKKLTQKIGSNFCSDDEYYIKDTNDKSLIEIFKDFDSKLSPRLNARENYRDVFVVF